MYLFELLFLFLFCFLDLYLGVELLDHTATLFLGFFKINLFIYFWLHWVFIAASGLSLVEASRGNLRCGTWASHCGGFSCCRSWALGVRASVVVAGGLSSCGSRALEHRLSTCGAWA